MDTRRKNFRTPSALLPLAMLLFWIACDSPFKKNKSKDDAAPPPAPTATAPADWDGKSDWQQNALKIKDIAP